METKPDLRPSPIAGQWYPANRQRLADSVDAYLDVAQHESISGQVVAIMAPHAGHLYSGPVAGYAFGALRGLSPELVAVVSPMHYMSFEPVLSSGHEAYATPLGPVYVDKAAQQALDLRLRKLLGFGLAPVRNDREHSLEIELPFLQRALVGEFKLLPVMLRDQRPEVARSLGQALAEVLRERSALLVASTDLSHFYTQEEALCLDSEILKAVEAFDPLGVLQAEDEGRGFACGKGALAAVMWAAKELGAVRAQVLHYGTSGDITGDTLQVVGYGAAVFTRPAV